MRQPPAHELSLHQAQSSWQHEAGPARFRSKFNGGLHNKLIDVEYTFAGAEIHACVDNVDVDLGAPVALRPAQIAKPWGQELWYTGMEDRGESRIEVASGTVPLSHYLELAPNRLCTMQPLVLLKILDPKPQPLIGDLYLEAHATKQEVYIVSSIDQDAWPDGTGAIRLGANQELRAQHESDEAFRAAYLDAVRAYEAVRREIDEGGSDAAETAALEQRTRAAMDAFTNLLPLHVGDIVTVSPWLPHSLQHGVRVVEFQTPTFERYIISFAQQVVTQAHWDSAHAIENLDLERPATPVAAKPGVQQIASCGDFNAWRISLAPGETQVLPFELPYAVCMTLSGSVVVNGLSQGVEQACFVPKSALPVTLSNPSELPAVCLAAASPI